MTENTCLPPRAVSLLKLQVLSGWSRWLDIFLVFSLPSFLWKSSPAEIALLGALLAAPSLLLGPRLGAVADRQDPQVVLSWSLRIRFLTSLGLAFVPHIAGFALLLPVLASLNTLHSATCAVIAQLAVPPAARLRYFARLSGLDQLGKIGVPVAAGFCMWLCPRHAGFLLSALLTLACIQMMRRWSPDMLVLRPADRLAPNVAIGLAPLRGLSPTLRISMCLSIGMCLTLGLYDTHVPAYLDASGFPVRMFSAIVSATACGAAVAAVCSSMHQTPDSLMRSGIAVFSLALLATAWLVVRPGPVDGPAFVTLWFLNGLGYEWVVIGTSATMQNLCPPALIGRVAASARSLQLCAIVAGTVMGAWLIAIHGRSAPFVLAAVCSLLLLGAMHYAAPHNHG